MSLLALAVAAAHVLAGAAWFGAMFYSFAVLHPRARSFFGSDVRMEEFITWIAAGARRKVLAGIAVVGLSGVALIVMSGANQPDLWWWCVGLKVLFLLSSLAVFAHVSWVLWPARLLAASAEIRQHQRRFRVAAMTLLCLVAANMALGIAASHLHRIIPPAESVASR